MGCDQNDDRNGTFELRGLELALRVVITRLGVAKVVVNTDKGPCSP